MAARTWTLEQRQRQAELIRSWSPWERSTARALRTGGPPRLAMRGGHRAMLRELARVLSEQGATLKRS
jgi:hypothetical protein